MKFYAKANNYGLNVTRDSGIWTIARFDSKKAREIWIDNLNGESCNLTADTCTRIDAQYILRKNINDIAESCNDYQTGCNQAFWLDVDGIDMVEFH